MPLRSLLFFSLGLLAFSISGEASTLAEIRQMGLGQQVTVSRAVIGNEIDLVASISSKSFQLQDETGGITIFGSNAAIDALLAGRSAGDELIGLSGQTAEFRGLRQLQGPFTLMGSVPGAKPPDSLPVTTDDFQNASVTAEGLESRLVTLRNVVFATSGIFEGGANYSASDGEREVTVRVATGNLPITGTLLPAGEVDVTGVFSQFTTNTPANDGYQLLVRTPEDIQTPTIFGQWQTNHFRGADLRDNWTSGSAGDPDGDGVPNLLEFAFEGDPRVPNTALLPEVLIGPGFQTSHLRLRFLRTAMAAPALIYKVEASSDLSGWDMVWSSIESPYPEAAGERFWQNASDPKAVETSPVRFLRLLVEKNEADLAAPMPQLRVVSWNIEWFPGRSQHATLNQEQEHIEQVKTYLANVNPDILLLQEIRDETSLSTAVSLLDGYKVHVVSAYRFGSELSRQQLAIASRLPAHTAFAERFSPPPDSNDPTPPRGFAFAALELPGNGILLCYSLHLKSNASGTAEENIRLREESARQVMKHQAEMQLLYAHRPVIYSVVGGDFNTLLQQPDMAHEQTLEIIKNQNFHWTWEGVPFSQRITWPGRGGFPDASFDHILTRDLGSPVARVLTQPSPNLSDHNPVEVILNQWGL